LFLRINSSPSGKGGILKGVANFLYTLKGQQYSSLLGGRIMLMDVCPLSICSPENKKDGDVEGARLTG
jgi:hypothetical protein